jgi:hypothetical protein
VCVCLCFINKPQRGEGGHGLFWSVAPHTTKGIFSCAELVLAGSILKTRPQILILSHLPLGVTSEISTYSTRSVFRVILNTHSDVLPISSTDQVVFVM